MKHLSVTCLSLAALTILGTADDALDAATSNLIKQLHIDTNAFAETASAPAEPEAPDEQENAPPAAPKPDIAPEARIQKGHSKDYVLDLLGKPLGNMTSRKGWELLLYEHGEVELTDGLVTRSKFRSPKESQQREEARLARIEARDKEIEAEEIARKERQAKHRAHLKLKAEQADKDEQAWREMMTERIGTKPTISSKKRKKRRNAGRWYWNDDGSINWDQVKANPPADPNAPIEEEDIQPLYPRELLQDGHISITP